MTKRKVVDYFDKLWNVDTFEIREEPTKSNKRENKKRKTNGEDSVLLAASKLPNESMEI